MMKLSVISPIYKGEKMLDELVSRIETSVETFTKDYEIILVNDSSPDDSWNRIKEICAKDKKVKGVNLSRNFGQHYAITAGLTESAGEWVVVMDCDLQDRPEEIPNLYQKAQEGYDTVFAEIQEREDGFLKKFTSRLYNYVYAYFTNSPVGRKTNNFGIYNRLVIDAVLNMGDYIRWFPIEVLWVGFKIGYYPVVKNARAEGKSSYTWRKLITYALNNIIAFSNKPLLLAVQFGFIIVLVSLAAALFFLFRYLTGGIGVGGFTTIVISLWLIAGIIVSLIGMVGVYVGRVFDESKGRPMYIIKEKVNL